MFGDLEDVLAGDVNEFLSLAVEVANLMGNIVDL